MCVTDKESGRRAVVVAFRSQYLPEGNYLIVPDTDDPKKFSWGSSGGWCMGEWDVVKDVTVYAEDGSLDWGGIFNEYLTAFPPVPWDGVGEPKYFSGWVSKDGEFYPCEYMGHSGLAHALSYSLYKVYCGEPCLEDNGFIRLYGSGKFAGTSRPTIQQVDILVKLLNQPSGSAIFKGNLKAELLALSDTA